MNIQICAPYQPCIYHCPMCIARGHQHQYKFENVWEKNKDKYFANLLATLATMNPECVVITGECDPTQNLAWLNSVLDIMQTCPTVKVELQTHNFNLNSFLIDTTKLDVLSYSIISSKDYLSAWRYLKPQNTINRLVILLTKDFNFLNKDNFSTMGFTQITFKSLQNTEDILTNEWIKNNNIDSESFQQIQNIMQSRNGSTTSIRIDTNCQEATGRYVIFRSDGQLYDSWEACSPSKSIITVEY